MSTKANLIGESTTLRMRLFLIEQTSMKPKRVGLHNDEVLSFYNDVNGTKFVAMT
jgi:hypothetical protein